MLQAHYLLVDYKGVGVYPNTYIAIVLLLQNHTAVVLDIYTYGLREAMRSARTKGNGKVGVGVYNKRKVVIVLENQGAKRL